MVAKRCKRSKNGVEETNANRPHHVSLIDEAKDDSVYGIAPKASISIDRHPDSRDKLIAATKEHCFLNSRNTGGQVSINLEDCTGEELCIKCDGSGQLLICNGNNCPLVVHQSCLGYEASFDKMGNFYCPFCSYRSAVAEFQGAKKELYFAKNALSIFLASMEERVPGCQRQANPSIACKEEEMVEEETKLGGHTINSSLTKGKDVLEKIFDENQSKNGEEELQAQCSVAHESSVTSTTGELTHQVSHQESMEGQLQKEAFKVCGGDDLPSGENFVVLPEIIDVSVSKRQRCNKNVFEEQPSISEVENAGDENKEDVALGNPIKSQGATKWLNPVTLNLGRRKRHWSAEEEEILKDGV
ncbi:hypothetical protein NE237_000478 [Protea cynaroides]|uniref:PHD-type domain-containing protein n=1 Tax=Protea cynaroides TaxID=273540 RepID=A0A9Q0QXH1_9MAGN|nr:hypothetical protein NE237_000478 [Protea cynaroides]